MITKVSAYHSWTTSPTPWVVDLINRAAPSEPIGRGERHEIRNIDGLGAVAAAINTSPLGTVDGESFVGSSVGKRNIVLTVGANPDWGDYTPGELRRDLNLYFTPKRPIRLVFETMEFSPVEISGYVESNEPNIFSEDPEHIISIICPDPYFKSVSASVIASNDTFALLQAMTASEIAYEGDIETGFELEITAGNDAAVQPTTFRITVRDPLENYIEVGGSPLSANEKLVYSSVARNKSIKSYLSDGSPKVNLLNEAIIVDLNDRDTRWPILHPGTISVDVDVNIEFENTVVTVAKWPQYELSFYNRFASL